MHAPTLMAVGSRRNQMYGNTIGGSSGTHGSMHLSAASNMFSVVALRTLVFSVPLLRTNTWFCAGVTVLYA